MKQLFRFEWKKIMSSRLNQIVVVGCMLAIGVMTLLTVNSHEYFSNNGLLKGLEAVQAEKEGINQVSGIMDEERITEDISEYQKLYDDPKNIFANDGYVSLKDSVFVEHVYPKYDYLVMINSIFAGPFASDYELKTIEKLKSPYLNFYEMRNSNIERIVSNDFSNLQFTEAEKDYWINKNEKVETPFEYGYAVGWTKLLFSFEFFVFVLISIAICISPVFANEYQSGADQIILSSKLGKSKLIQAKIGAAYLFGTAVLTLNYLITIIIIWCTFGLEGGSLPVQAIHITNPYPWTIAQFVFVQMLTGYMLMFGIVALTLWLSAKLRTAFSALIPVLLLLIVPMFITRQKSDSMWNSIHSLLPFPSLRSALGKDELTFNSFSLGNIVLDVFSMRISVYILLGCILIYMSRKAFKNHQIS